MQKSPHEIKEQLLGALDKDYNVVDMDTVIYVITALEKVTITKDVLEKTRLGRYINELRKRTSNENLARRAKDLVKSWRKLIPQNDHVVNGERVAGGITPPGPGPGLKPSSPALGKTGVRTPGVGTATPTLRHKPASLLVPSDRIASPLCSSASSSPLLYTIKTCTRPLTPSGYAPNKCASSSSSVHSCDSQSVPRQQGDRNSALPAPHNLTFKPVSPALAGSFNKSGTSTFGPSPVLCPKPHSPAIGSTNSTKPKSPCLNSGKFIPGRHEYENNQAVHSPASFAGNAHCSLDLAKTNAANKRLRKENANCSSSNNQSHMKPNPNAPVNTSHATVNGLDCAPEKNLLDGPAVRPSNCSAFQSFKSDDYSQDSNSAIDNSFVRTKKRLKYGSAADGCEATKEKTASSKLQKVKTTQQLIEELQLKTGTKMPSVTLPVVTAPAVLRTDNCKNPTAARKAKLAFMASDAEMTKTKSELMDRFLKSSPDGVHNTSPLMVKAETKSPNLQSYQADGKEECAIPYIDTVSEEITKLMESLPKIDPSILSCMEEDEEDSLPSRTNSVTEADIQRVFDEHWDHVNGIFDRSCQWHEWQETATVESLNGDPLHILPYVNIDW